MTTLKSRGSRSTELEVAKRLREIYGMPEWRRHFAILGAPDFVWKTEKVAVFVDGSFWHGCPSCYRAPPDKRAVLARKNQAKSLSRFARYESPSG